MLGAVGTAEKCHKQHQEPQVNARGDCALARRSFTGCAKASARGVGKNAVLSKSLKNFAASH
jgi:hypothetical protein